MRWARGLVLIFAIFAAVSAAYLARKAATPRQAVIQPVRTETVDILVAARAIALGEMVKANDVRWQQWPQTALPPASIRSEGASPPPFVAASARYPILAGEPISEAKLVRNGEGGILASLVGPGMRAISVPIREETAAGGFIQPQDRVDVLLARRKREDMAAPDIASEILLHGVKVLAIGTGLDGKGAASAKSRTATLELTQDQARIMAGAQTAGEISLALIPSAESSGISRPETGAGAPRNGDIQPAIRIMKFGRLSSERPAR